jgi:hypothetical protein
MSHTIRTLSLAVILATAATAATAQTNPASRGTRDSFSFGSIHGAAPQTQSGTISSPLQQSGTAIGRPVGRFGPVTPVPEPSEWAMMLAGLALVGFIVRRNSKRS